MDWLIITPHDDLSRASDTVVQGCRPKTNSARRVRSGTRIAASGVVRSGLGLLVVLMTSACETVPFPSPVMNLPVIECRPALEKTVCDSWGESVLLRNRTLATTTARLVLTRGPTVDGRCAADFFDINAVLLATAATVCPPLIPSPTA